MKNVQREAEEIEERLKEHPELLEQVRQLLEEVDDPKGKIANIDDAEDVIAERIRQMARNALESWAQSKAAKVPTRDGALRGGKITALAITPKFKQGTWHRRNQGDGRTPARVSSLLRASA